MLNTRLIETDAYDRDAFARVVRHVPDVADLQTRGAHLVPHFDALLEDLFALLFKLVVEVRPADQSPVSTGLNRQILRATIDSREYADLKEETALDAARSAHAACGLARRALALLKTGEMLLEEELLAAKQLAEAEESLEQKRAAARDLAGHSPEIDAELAKAIRDEEQRTGELAESVERSLREVPSRFSAEISAGASGLADRLPRFDDAGASFARSVGGSGPRTAGERLRLAEKLEKSTKLRKLAQLAGAFRAEARGARRQRRERGATEVYRVGLGSQLSRLLPSELVALRNPLRRREFLRRFVEEQLSQYDLRGDDRQGRGPIVVCIDGSGSMSGNRELWAKAVALALLDSARKQGRRTRAIVFSGPEAELSAFELTGRGKLGGRRPVDLEAVTELAECFPGGGTDFEKPLRAALDAVRGSALRGADIVFVTDGEAQISAAFADEFKLEKKKRDLNLFAVLVDDASRNEAAASSYVPRAARELGKVADEMTTITELTSGAVKELFRRV